MSKTPASAFEPAEHRSRKLLACRLSRGRQGWRLLLRSSNQLVATIWPRRSLWRKQSAAAQQQALALRAVDNVGRRKIASWKLAPQSEDYSVDREFRFVAGCLIAGVIFCVQTSAVAFEPANLFKELRSGRIAHPAVNEVFLTRAFGDRLNIEEAKEKAKIVLGWPKFRLELLVEPHGLHWSSAWDFPCLHCNASLDKLTFTLEHPEQLDCSACGKAMRMEDYPLNAGLDYENAYGKSVKIPYHKAGDKEVHLYSVIKSRLHADLTHAALGCGMVFRKNSRERATARRGIEILFRLAEVYPHWPNSTREADKRSSQRFSGGPFDRAIGGHRWSAGPPLDEVGMHAILAYDYVYRAVADWRELSIEKGIDAKLIVENDLLRLAYRIALTADKDMGYPVFDEKGAYFRNQILTGMVLNEPGYIYDTMARMARYHKYSYHTDGMGIGGSMSRHLELIERTREAEELLTSYRVPRLEFAPLANNDNIVSLERRIRLYDRARKLVEDGWQSVYPDGTYLPLHDTWVGSLPKGRTALPGHLANYNIELPDSGHFAVSRGTKGDWTQVHLHFCPLLSEPLGHDDQLQIMLYGAGRELLTDAGAAPPGAPEALRRFAASRINHNTVNIHFQPGERPKRLAPLPTATFPDVVMKRKMEANLDRPFNNARSTILEYSTAAPQVQLISAASPGPVWHGIRRSERTVLLVPVPPDRSLVFDSFCVDGGHRHDFVLRPMLDEEVEESASVKVEATLPKFGDGDERNIPFAEMFREIKVASGEQPWELTWTGKTSGASLRCFFAGNPDSEVLIARSPSIRRADEDGDYAKALSPHLIVQTKGADGLKSKFSAVYEAVAKGREPVVTGVKYLVSEVETGTSLVEVQTAERVILIYNSLDRKVRKSKRFSFSGRHVVVSTEKDGSVRGTWLYDATFSDGANERVSRREDLGPARLQRKEDHYDLDGVVCKYTGDVSQLARHHVIVRIGKEEEGVVRAYPILGVEKLDEEGTVRLRTDADSGIRSERGVPAFQFYPWNLVHGGSEASVVVPWWAGNW